MNIAAERFFSLPLLVFCALVSLARQKRYGIREVPIDDIETTYRRIKLNA